MHILLNQIIIDNIHKQCKSIVIHDRSFCVYCLTVSPLYYKERINKHDWIHKPTEVCNAVTERCVHTKHPFLH